MKDIKQIALATALLVMMLFTCNKTGTERKEVGHKPAIIRPQVIARKVTIDEQRYRQGLDSLELRNRWLSKKLSATEASLSVARQKSKELGRQVKKLLDKPDSIGQNNGADSLSARVDELFIADAEKDSLFEAVNSGLKLQVQNRDSVIGVHRQQYLSLKTHFAASLQQQQTLLDENMLYKKQLKKERFKKGLLSAGMLILSGLTVSHLLSR